MVIDSHEHIMLPIEIQLDKMDAAGMNKTMLFCTAPNHTRRKPVHQRNCKKKWQS